MDNVRLFEMYVVCETDIYQSISEKTLYAINPARIWVFIVLHRRSYTNLQHYEYVKVTKSRKSMTVYGYIVFRAGSSINPL